MNPIFGERRKDSVAAACCVEGVFFSNRTKVIYLVSTMYDVLLS